MCYVLPILACVGSHSNGRTLALIVVPVQTLVTQIEQVCKYDINRLIQRFCECGSDRHVTF